MTEHQLYEMIARYLQMQYPDVLYRFDLAADLKLTVGQAAKHKRLHPKRGWPDMFIAKSKVITLVKRSDEEGGSTIQIRFGLFLELKKDGETLCPGPRAKKRFKSIDDKEYKTEHLMEQADMLHALRKAGYKAEFACGFDEAKRIIDEYLGGGKHEVIEF